MSTLVEHLRWLAEIAYKAGAHELGYDPVQSVAELIEKAQAVDAESLRERDDNDRLFDLIHELGDALDGIGAGK